MALYFIPLGTQPICTRWKTLMPGKRQKELAKQNEILMTDLTIKAGLVSHHVFMTLKLFIFIFQFYVFNFNHKYLCIFPQNIQKNLYWMILN